jgi:RNase P subunit RPR2
MAKKKQNKPKTVQDATTLSRINFLHQAAHVVPLPLQRHYLATSKVAQKKTMLKLDPNLKRLSCRRCSALLSPQSGNIKTRITAVNEKNDLLEIECRHCGTKRRFTISENFTLYSEKEPVEIAQIH